MTRLSEGCLQGGGCAGVCGVCTGRRDDVCSCAWSACRCLWSVQVCVGGVSVCECVQGIGVCVGCVVGVCREYAGVWGVSVGVCRRVGGVSACVGCGGVSVCIGCVQVCVCKCVRTSHSSPSAFVAVTVPPRGQNKPPLVRPNGTQSSSSVVHPKNRELLTIIAHKEPKDHPV